MRKLTAAALVALVGVVAAHLHLEHDVDSLNGGRPAHRQASGRVTVWQATDGYQFQVIPVPQNPPWGCVPLKSPIEAPAEWAMD